MQIYAPHASRSGIIESGVLIPRLRRLVFHSAKQVTRIGKRRYPLIVDQHGVPTDMIGVQMGAKNGLDALARKTRLG